MYTILYPAVSRPVVWCVTAAPAICHVAMLRTVHLRQLDMIMGMVCCESFAMNVSCFCREWILGLFGMKLVGSD